jgi:hypothetical protein
MPATQTPKKTSLHIRPHAHKSWKTPATILLWCKTIKRRYKTAHVTVNKRIPAATQHPECFDNIGINTMTINWKQRLVEIHKKTSISWFVPGSWSTLTTPDALPAQYTVSYYLMGCSLWDFCYLEKRWWEKDWKVLAICNGQNTLSQQFERKLEVVNRFRKW